MNNGYYVSAYCCIDEAGCVLNAQIRHDQAIALWKLSGQSVELIKYWELERLTRQKQHMRPFLDKNHFLYVLTNLLKEVDIGIEEIVSIIGMPEFDDDDTYVNIAKVYGVPFHSIGHIFSALISTKTQFKGKLLVLALDGGPDNVLDRGFDLPCHYAGAIFDDGKLVTIKPINSPAYIWAEASEKFLLREGTLMALAEACTCRYEDSDLELKIDSFQSMWDITRMRVEFERVWGIIEKAELAVDERFTLNENRISCFMKILQVFSRNMVRKDIEKIIDKFNIDPSETILSIVGGFALNCPTNTWLMKEFGFREFIAPPCVNDSGMALGIGLTFFYNEFKENMKYELSSAFYGHQENWNSFEKVFGKYIHSVSDFNINIFVQDIECTPVCWFEGSCEIGPRALGHRSILASATSIEMKDRLNTIKQREWWRPVAPIILSEAVDTWCVPNFMSPYMLHAVQIAEDKRDFVPAILHLNNSARVQTINENSSFYSVLKKYYDITGIPIICNTSLNDKGEPIINTYPELLNFVSKKKLSIIYVEKKRVVLKKLDLYDEDAQKRVNNAFDEYLLSKKKVLDSKYSNFKIDEDTLDFFINHKAYFSGLSVTSPQLKQKVKEMRERIYENLSSGNSELL